MKRRVVVSVRAVMPRELDIYCFARASRHSSQPQSLEPQTHSPWSRLPTILLEWCTLEPSGSSQLAAIRFNTPVRVKTIKIFPTGTQPFALCPDVVA